MLVGSGDVLATLSRVLLAVGGKESRFLHRMHERMSQLEVNDRQWPYAVISESKGDGDSGRVIDLGQAQDERQKEQQEQI